MHIKLLVLFALVSVVRNHDVLIGSDGGRKIFEDTRYAGPAIWRQIENVTVIAPINEVISKVNITDLRAAKDGDVDIVNGGLGEQSVTIEIKSPTVLRSYEFHLEVFSVPKSNYKISENADKGEEIPEDILNNEDKTTTQPQINDSENSDTDIPIEKDSDALRPARQTNDENDNTKSPDESETTITSTETLYKDNTGTEDYPSTEDTVENNDGTTESVEGSGNEENSATVIPPEWLRPVRGADSENDLTAMPVETEAAITTTESFNIDYTTIDDIPDEGVYNHDSTTEVLEIVPIDPAVRPARETDYENESKTTNSETLNKETTEATLKANDNNDRMITPDTYVKNSPDYSAMSILDYIKSRQQGNRKARRWEIHDDYYTQSPDKDQNNDNENSSSTEDYDSTNKKDDTFDLIPPEIDASYNDNFTPALESTEEPIELSTTEVTTTLDATDEESTPMPEDATTESSLEEKSRNSRNTEDNLENSNSFDLTSETETSNEPSIPIKNNVSTGIVFLKGDHVIITADGKQAEFTLPIVLIIGNENNFPMFKLVEDSTDIEKKDLEVESTSDDTPDITMDYEATDDTSDAAGDAAGDAASDIAKNEEYSY